MNIWERSEDIEELGLRSSKDREIFDAARESGVVVVTKDRDFRELLERLGSPPSVIWITCGNTSNARLIEIHNEHYLRL